MTEPLTNSCNRIKALGQVLLAPLHRPQGWQSEERRQAKAIALNSWYRPHNTVCFVPATPNSELAKKLQEFVDKEMQKINMSAKIVAGISIRDQTVKLQGVPEKTLVSV